MPAYAFRRQAKLLKTDEFSSVFNFRKRVSGQYLVLHYRHNELAYARLGLVVGRKTARRAVDRNYIKRVMRELFRVNQHQLPGLDLVARPHRMFGRQQFAEIEQEFTELVAKLQRKLASRQEQPEC
ncbi:MAG: ribonuclease P protein component [Methylobacillus sp.]|nr:ribonuclease P protein component [Methylobacillus sp.]